MIIALLLVASAWIQLSLGCCSPVPAFCNQTNLASFIDDNNKGTDSPPLELCKIVAEWRQTNASARGQFVTQNFATNHIIYGSVVPFAGLFTTHPNSTDKSDVFMARFAIFNGPLIDNYLPTDVGIVALADDTVIVKLNLTGTATQTGKTFNSKTTLTYHFVGDYWWNAKVDYLTIVSDSDPLIEAFTPDPTTEPTSAAPTSSSPTSASPTSASPTSSSPTSASPTTASPTSASPTSVSPTASPTVLVKCCSCDMTLNPTESIGGGSTAQANMFNLTTLFVTISVLFLLFSF